MKHRLEMIESNQKVKNANPNKPTLRKRTDQNKGGSTSTDGQDPNSTNTGLPLPQTAVRTMTGRH